MKKLVILLILAFVCLIYTNNSNTMEIPYSSIRIRVIAASNTQQDQNNKLIVKSAIQEKLKSLNYNSYEEVDDMLKNDDNNINKVVSDTIKTKNINDSFKINYGYNYFPEKEMNGIKYPAGNYKSYVVTLGEGNGENWWCVLYPPICTIDNTSSTENYEFLVKRIIEKYQ